MSKKRMDMPIRMAISDFPFAIAWVQDALKTIGPWNLVCYEYDNQTTIAEVGHSAWRIARNWEVAS